MKIWQRCIKRAPVQSCITAQALSLRTKSLPIINHFALRQSWFTHNSEEMAASYTHTHTTGRPPLHNLPHNITFYPPACNNMQNPHLLYEWRVDTSTTGPQLTEWVGGEWTSDKGGEEAEEHMTEHSGISQELVNQQRFAVTLGLIPW